MREKIAIFLISLAIIGFQLAIINLLSYSQWHHFAYLAVSIAMLGFGSSGVILSVWADFFRNKAEIIFPWLFLITGLLMFISPLLVDQPWIRFDTFLLFTSYSHIIKLFLTCFILFIPFLLGATVIGLFFMLRSEQISLLYAWNLGGSAMGGIILVWLSNYLLPMNLVAIFGFGSVVGGVIIGKIYWHRFFGLLIATIGIVVLLIQPSVPFTSEFKSLSKTLLIPNTQVNKQIPLTQGTLEIVSSENLRHVNGLSLNYTGSVPIVDVAFLNAQWYSVFERGEVDSSFYNQNLYALPFLHIPKPNVLLLQPNSTFFASQAKCMNAKQITIVEPIKTVADSLKIFPAFKNKVTVINAYPREYLLEDDELWDIISFPLAGSAGAAGLSAILEQYLYTTNAIGNAFNMLSPNGLLVLSAYMDNPPRYSLKLLSMIADGLADMGLKPTEHILAIRSWNTMLITVSREPSSNEFNHKAIAFAYELGFDMVHPTAQDDLNILSDSTFQIISQAIIADEDNALLRNYAFNLDAPSDNSPFFGQFTKISQLRNYLAWFGMEGVPFLELGYFIVWASLLVCLALALLAIVFPLFASLKQKKFLVSIWIYFSLLGLAYMLLEVSLIQRSILTLGNPITASATIISALLCFSAIGSYYSSQLSTRKTLWGILLGIAVLILLLALLGDSLSALLIQKSFFIRVALLVISIAPMGVLMGMAFPMGMAHLSKDYPDQIPIAWGMNGFFSVLAAPIATIIAVELGFMQVLLLSSFLYFICLLIAMLFLIKKKMCCKKNCRIFSYIAYSHIGLKRR